jgi:hypothetical protein
VADIQINGIILNEPFDARCLMGAFWNPNGGLIVNGSRLSKKEVSGLKRKGPGNHLSKIDSLKRWWGNIKFIVLALFS